MTDSLRSPRSRNPWRELPREIAHVLRPELSGIAGEMVEAITSEVHGYRQSLDTPLGRDLVSAVRRALWQFVELIENPDCSQEENAAFFRHLGRAEFRTGRGMEGLQEAYRVGARVACHRYTEAARAASVPTDTLLLLSEAVLAHINALANESVLGYQEEQARGSTDLQQRRRALAQRLLERNPGSSSDSLAALAAQAEWALPNKIACVVLATGQREPRFDAHKLEDAVLVLHRGGETVLLVPEPAGERLRRVGALVYGHRAALGPTTAPGETWLSLQCARMTMRMVRRGLVPADGMVPAMDHLGDLVLLGGEHINRLLGEHTLGKLDKLTTVKAARLEQTLDALLSSWGRTAPEVASALGVHPQTARNRLRQLDELFGERLADPRFRFDAQLVLHTRALLRAQGTERTRAQDEPVAS